MKKYHYKCRKCKRDFFSALDSKVVACPYCFHVPCCGKGQIRVK